MINLVVAENKKYDYTLLVRVNENFELSYCPFVVAWKYHKKTDSWEQGHYFQDMKTALMYMMFKDEYNEIYEVLKDKLDSPF